MLIEIKGIKKYYGKKKVLDGITFDCRGGEFIAVAGGNGCGKSTLLGVLGGTLSGEGSFLIDGVDVLKQERTRRKLVGYIPQTPPLFEELSAKDHLQLFWGRKGMKSSTAAGIISMLGIDEFMNVTVRRMSGGMKKRLSVACAVAHGPSVLLLDEVAASLDPECRESIFTYFDAFRRAGGVVISVTHDLSEIRKADKCYILKEGMLHRVEDDRRFGALEELYL